MSETPFGAGRLAPVDTNKIAAANPANSPMEKLDLASQARTRIPMSIPRLKLSTPELPGYHCHWVNDYPGRVMQAIQAGYAFVPPDEALITMPDLGGSPLGGGTDLGSRVSVVVGATTEGTPLRAYLMKLPNEFFKADQEAVQSRVDSVDEAMAQGNLKVEGDTRHRYVKSHQNKSTYSRRG